MTLAVACFVYVQYVHSNAPLLCCCVLRNRCSLFVCTTASSRKSSNENEKKNQENRKNRKTVFWRFPTNTEACWKHATKEEHRTPLFSVNYLAFRQGTKRGEVARSSSTMRRAAGTGPPNNSPGAAGYGAPNRGVGSMEGGGSSPMDPEMGSSYGAGTAGSLKRVRLKLLVA